jgi:hypothetical protein
MLREDPSESTFSIENLSSAEQKEQIEKIINLGGKGSVSKRKLGKLPLDIYKEKEGGIMQNIPEITEKVRKIPLSERIRNIRNGIRGKEILRVIIHGLDSIPRINFDFFAQKEDPRPLDDPSSHD